MKVDVDPELYFRSLGPGLLMLTPLGSRLRNRIAELLTEQGSTAGLDLYEACPVLPMATVERAGFLTTHPRLVGAVASFRGSQPAHFEVLKAVRQGNNIAPLLSAGEQVLAPAACHSMFAMLTKTEIFGDVTFAIRGNCYRAETQTEPGRLRSFSMLEFLACGKEETAIGFAERWISSTGGLLDEAFGLGTEAVEAEDSFFGISQSPELLARKPIPRKVELIHSTTFGRIAIASVNYHASHFGQRFGIRLGDSAIFSSCVAFGLERLMLSLFESTSKKSRLLLSSVA